MSIALELLKEIVVVIKNMNFLKDKKGFTLIEVLLYVAIVGGILTLISVFLMTLLESRIKNDTISEVEYQGLQVMHVITQSIRNADVVSNPLKGETDSILDINNGDINFYLENGVIYIEKDSQETELTNNRVVVTNLLFENLGLNNAPDSVRISFVLSYNNIEGRNEYSFYKEFIGSASLRDLNNDL